MSPFSSEFVIEIKTENDINNLIKLNESILNEADRERLKSDFKKGYFSGFFALDNSKNPTNFEIDSIFGYVLYYNSYSTWQNRVLYISDLK